MNLTFFKRTLLAASIVATSASSFAVGELDETWTDSSLYQSRAASQFTDVAATPDGNFVAVGKMRSVAGTEFEQLIVKFNKADGTLDTSFGANGQAFFTPALDSTIEAVAVQADGKILTLGVMRESTSDDWQLVVQRLNTDGTPDLDFADDSIFTKTIIDLKTSEVLAKDIVINSRGEIIFSVNKYKGASWGISRYYSKLLKLDADGVEDTAFSPYVTSNTEGTSSSYSTELTRVIMDNNNNIFALGQLNMVRSGQEPKTQSWTSFADVTFGGANTNGGLNTTWLQDPDINSSASVQKSQINGATITPNNVLISAGCDSNVSSLTLKGYSLSTGEMSATFGTNGSVAPADAPYLYSGDCFNDVIYHSTYDAIFTVGVSKGKAIILAADPDTGATIDFSLNSSSSAGYNSIALLDDGSMAVVGRDGSKALVTLLDGDTLAQATVVSDVTFADQLDVSVNTALSTANETLMIAPANTMQGKVYDGSASVNDAGLLNNTVALNDGDTLSLHHTSASQLNTSQTTRVVIDTQVSNNVANKQWSAGDKFITFTSKTVAVLNDTSPDAFSFAALNDTQMSVSVTSEVITISGINALTDISISNSGTGTSEYSINGGAFTSAAGVALVENGDEIQVRHTSSAQYDQTSESVLIIGGMTAYFESTTLADETPDPFTFTAQLSAPRNTAVESNEVTISGLGANVNLSVNVTNGEYSINNGPFRSSQVQLLSKIEPRAVVKTTVANGDTLKIRQTTSSDFNTQTTSTVTIGGEAAAFLTRTVALDDTPTSFSFTAVTDATLETQYSTAEITIYDINTSVDVSITGGTYSINGAAAQSSSGTVVSGDRVQVFVTSSDLESTTLTATLVVGNVSQDFSVTTSGSSTAGSTDTSTSGGSSSGGSIPFSMLFFAMLMTLLTRKRN